MTDDVEAILRRIEADIQAVRNDAKIGFMENSAQHNELKSSIEENARRIQAESRELIAAVSARVDVNREKLDNVVSNAEDHVSVDAFTPVKLLVYGLTGIILSSFIYALVSLVQK